MVPLNPYTLPPYAGTPLLDMNYLEDAGGGPDVSVAMHTGLSKIVLLQMDNRCAPGRGGAYTGVLLLVHSGQ